MDTPLELPFHDLLPPVEEMEEACLSRDPAYDGIFVFGVTTTGIVCRPTCPSRPHSKHVRYFATLREAIAQGYRPCQRCRPEQLASAPPEDIATLMDELAAAPDRPIRARDLRERNISPERVRRWFRQNYGMTFAEWQRGQRLSRAFTQLRSGETLDEVIFGSGFDSHSGFRAAFEQAVGDAPGRVRNEPYVALEFMETRLGAMIAGAVNGEFCVLEFADRRGLERQMASLRKRMGRPLLPGSSHNFQVLKEQINAYLDRKRDAFDLPLLLVGSDFEKRVWQALMEIPYGETCSYQHVAKMIGQPSAVRAVARAIGANRLNIIIPCHRVIGADASLTGYAGGVHRKRVLLRLENPERNYC